MRALSCTKCVRMFRLGVGHPHYNLSGKFIVYNKIENGIRVYKEDSRLLGCKVCRWASGSRRFESRALETSGTTATQHHIPEDLNRQQYGCDNLTVTSVVLQSHALCHSALISKRQCNLHSAKLKPHFDRTLQLNPEVHKSRSPERLNSVPW